MPDLDRRVRIALYSNTNARQEDFVAVFEAWASRQSGSARSGSTFVTVSTSAAYTIRFIPRIREAGNDNLGLLRFEDEWKARRFIESVTVGDDRERFIGLLVGEEDDSGRLPWFPGDPDEN